MIVAAVRAKQSEEYRAADYHPRLHELPDAVRNVVGALRTHGFGLDKQVLDEPFLNSLSLSKRTFFQQEQQHPVAPSSRSHQQIATMRNISASSWRGDGTVSTFQPVWGSDIRAERVKEYKAKRKPKPPTVARVSTAPPRMVALSDDDDDEM